MLPLLTMAQISGDQELATGGGIHFLHGVTWQKVLETAQRSNKHILVDCFTTWCAPCKKMDEEVFTQSIIGSYINKEFIAIKVQMDSSKNDNNETITWYNQARVLKNTGDIRAFPTYLFFSPDGSVVHKGVGVKTASEFLALAENALNPEKQYYSLLSRYNQGRTDSITLSRLLSLAQEDKNDSLASRVGREYLSKILYAEEEADLMKKEKLIIIWKYADAVREKGFGLFYKNQKLIDSIIGVNGASRRFIDRVVKSSEIEPELKKGSPGDELDWKQLETKIAREFNQEMADRLILGAQLEYYQKRKNWKLFAAAFENHINKFPPKVNSHTLGGMFGDSWELNEKAWLLFLKCDERKTLKAGLKWIDMALRLDPESVQMLDTKANLLYKVGRLKDAILCEEMALAKVKEHGETVFIQPYTETITKMKKNEPTW